MIRKPNFIILTLVCFFVVVEILILRPTKIEQGEETTTNMFDSIERVMKAQKSDDEIGYTIEGFRYTAVEGEIKQWEMNANQSVLYEKSKLIHALNAKIRMYDSTGKITLIEGDNAFYKMGGKNLEMKGHVKVTFPDGFWIKTEQSTYSGITGIISGPDFFEGESVPNPDEIMKISGIGFQASKFNPLIDIKDSANATMRRKSIDEVTHIKSDISHIDRQKRFAEFIMKSPSLFVESTKGTLFVRSRRQDATYDSKSSSVKYMTAYDDVYIKEMDKTKKGLKYATSQKADFYALEDKIVLSGFPSAYQESDTLTGELITIFRKKNIVEVTDANALHNNP